MSLAFFTDFDDLHYQYVLVVKACRVMCLEKAECAAAINLEYLRMTNLIFYSNRLVHLKLYFHLSFTSFNASFTSA